MKKNTLRYLFVLTVLASVGIGNMYGQTSIVAIGTTISQDFNTLTTSTLPATWTSNSTLASWYASTDYKSSFTNQYKADDGSTTSSGIYSFGSTSNSDRSLGFYPAGIFFTGSVGKKAYLGWRLKNNTGKRIGTIRVVWSGEQWRKAADYNTQFIKLSYQIGSSVTNLTTGTYILTTSEFASPQIGGSAATLDGNLAENRVSGITIDINNLDIPAGSEIMLRWEDSNDAINHTLSIDDISVTATKEIQTITFDDFLEYTYGDPAFDLTGSSSSGLPVNYTSSDETVATISGSTVTITGAGSTTITAIQAGNENVLSATPVERVLLVYPQAPNAIEASNITAQGFTANWEVGGGAQAYYLYYSTDPEFNTADLISVENVLSYNLTGLAAGTTYYYLLLSMNTGNYSGFSNVIEVSTGTGIQTYDITTSPTFTTSTIGWTNGNLTSRAVFMKEGTGIITNPNNDYKYNANSDWNIKGDELGSSGYYCIYYGSGSSVEVTNLYPGTLYTIQAFEFNGTVNFEKYLTTEFGANNPNTFSPWSTTTFTNSIGVTTAEDFTTSTRWDHATVPTAALHPAVKVYVDGNCEVTTNAVANNLTINAAHDAVSPLLTIQSNASVTVNDTLKNEGGTSALQIKASSTVPNGSLIFHNASESPVQATIEMYSKAAKSSSYKWQFMGIPVQTLEKSPTFVDGVNYVRRFNEAGWYAGYAETCHWVQLQNGATLSPFMGYEVTQLSGKTYSFSGNLVNEDYSSGQLSYTSGKQYPGQHLIGNPYTAAININALVFGTDNSEIMENSVYLYNTGSYDDWTTAGSGAASSVESSEPGQWIVIPKSVAGIDEYLPSQIPSMQAFLVKVLQDNSLATLSIPYSSTGTVTNNTSMQRAAQATKISTRIDVKGTNYTDRLWLISESACTRGFDNGWDGYKQFGASSAPQIYAEEVAGDFQVNTVDDFNNTKIGFIAGSDTRYTLTFNHQNMSLQYPTLYLVDLYDGTTTDISQDGSKYTFDAANKEPETRFKIINALDVSTGSQNIASGLKLYNSDKTIYLDNQTDYPGVMKLYDISGRIIQTRKFESNENFSVLTELASGLYILKAETAVTQKSIQIMIK
ncbi:MAG: T9SS type A sorting domain-containing protein [Paludibacter sp.]|nr:T9SS type A sorting domain-containing protein [Paludibacter sp.]